MRHVTYTDLRHNLARHLDETVESRAPLLVTRQGGKPSLVILSKEACSSWQDSVYLLGNPANAARLIHSIEDADAGQVQAHDLVDCAS